LARIIIITAHSSTLVRFRGNLIREWNDRGHEVVAVGPEVNYERELADYGASYVCIPFNPTGTNPIRELGLFWEFIKLFRRQKPDIVFSYHIKPVLYASIAAKMTGVAEVYSMITGLGYAFMGESLKRKLLRGLVVLQYKYALKRQTAVFFQNADDLALFKQLGINSNAVLVNGSGVDVDQFRYSPSPNASPVFLFMGRLLKDKGIHNFLEAAEIVKRKNSHVRFQILGAIDGNPAAIKKEDLDKWVDKGIVEYLGFADEVYPYLEKCSVFVLPSYREGVPRSTLEAMSVGRPIITTDAPGCRETVVEGYNGFLVPVNDSARLAEAMERFVKEPQLMDEFGKNSRKIVEERFHVKKVNRVILESMRLI